MCTVSCAASCGAVGLPVRTVRALQLGDAITGFQERWWFEASKKPNCAQEEMLNSKEGKKAFEVSSIFGHASRHGVASSIHRYIAFMTAM